MSHETKMVNILSAYYQHVGIIILSILHADVSIMSVLLSLITASQVTMRFPSV